MSDKRYEILKPLKNQIYLDNKTILETLEISLSHSTKHINYFNYKEEKAGWYLHFSPIHIENHDGWQSRQTQLFHDRSFKMFCNEASRFSKTRFEKLKKVLDENIDKIVELYDNQENSKLFWLIQEKFGEIK